MTMADADQYSAIGIRQLVTWSTRHRQISEKSQWQRMIIHNHQTLNLTLTVLPQA